MRKLAKVLILIVLIIIYSYVLAIEKIPDKIIIFEGETIRVKNFMGFNIKTNEETIQTSASNNNQLEPRKNNYGSKFI